MKTSRAVKTVSTSSSLFREKNPRRLNNYDSYKNTKLPRKLKINIPHRTTVILSSRTITSKVGSKPF